MLRDTGDFRLMSLPLIDALLQLREQHRFMKGLFAWVGFNQVGVDYVRPEQAAGSSTWRYWKLWNFALDGLTSFSSVPIRIWSYVGFAAAVLAFIFAATIIGRTLLFGADVPGYPSIVVILLLSFGVQDARDRHARRVRRPHLSGSEGAPALHRGRAIRVRLIWNAPSTTTSVILMASIGGLRPGGGFWAA